MKNNKTHLLATAILLASAVAADVCIVKIKPDEQWWGGSVILGENMPYGENSSAYSDFLMVAPQARKGATSREVEVPPGGWMPDEGTAVKAPCRLTVNTPLSRMPYFTRVP